MEEKFYFPHCLKTPLFKLAIGIFLLFSFNMKASADLSFDINTLAYKTSENTTNFYGIYTLSLYQPLNSRLQWMLNVSRLQNYSYNLNNNSSSGDWQNPSVGASYAFSKSSLDFLKVSALFTVPASQSAINKDFQGSSSLQLSLGHSFKRLKFNDFIQYTYSFYQYDIADNGEVLAPHLLSIGSTIQHILSKTSFVGLLLAPSWTLSFQGTLKSYVFTKL
ncbi:MAG: hypothetical protein D6797_09725, partial [Bdellovibrio sp.]